MTSLNPRYHNAIAALLVSLNLCAWSPMAASAQKITQIKGIIKGGKVVYTPPKDVGTPKNSVGGISRGECKEVRCLMALMPNTSSGVEHFPRTISAYPTFFFNAPKFSGVGQFRLYEVSANATPKRIYKTTFPIETQPGIISFSLPKDAPALQSGKFYRWDFSWNNPDQSTCVGVVQRVELDRAVLQQLDKAKPLEKASIYARAGVWFETVGALAEARRDRPEDAALMTEWSDLLRSVGLDVIVLQPISPASLNAQTTGY